MIDELLKLMDASADKAKLTATAKAALQTKLTALAIDPLLVTLPLDAARALIAGRHEETVRALMAKMTLAQMKKASKSWNPNRKPVPKDMGLADLRRELRELLERKAEPVEKVARASRARR
jgi:hypothetical protein